jgi:hypothetical protein
MGRFMRLSVALFLILISMSAARCVAADDHTLWLPHSVETMQRSASSKTDFAFDHSMLVFASKMDPDNADLRRVIAGVSGISVHKYRFPESWQDEPVILNSLKQEYRGAGWMKMVDNHDKNGGPGATDVWVHMENNAVSGVALLFAKSNAPASNPPASCEITFVTISGSISPADLSHLGGHFGIPQIQGGVVVPNPRP